MAVVMALVVGYVSVMITFKICVLIKYCIVIIYSFQVQFIIPIFIKEILQYKFNIF